MHVSGTISSQLLRSGRRVVTEGDYCDANTQITCGSGVPIRKVDQTNGRGFSALSGRSVRVLPALRQVIARSGLGLQASFRVPIRRWSRRSEGPVHDRAPVRRWQERSVRHRGSGPSPAAVGRRVRRGRTRGAVPGWRPPAAGRAPARQRRTSTMRCDAVQPGEAVSRSALVAGARTADVSAQYVDASSAPPDHRAAGRTPACPTPTAAGRARDGARRVPPGTTGG